jgi:hypothetical protein
MFYTTCQSRQTKNFQETGSFVAEREGFVLLPSLAAFLRNRLVPPSGFLGYKKHHTGDLFSIPFESLPTNNKTAKPFRPDSFVAEREGFEPSRPVRA